MKLFVSIGPHIIRKSQIVRVVNQTYKPHPIERPYATDSYRVITLRDGSELTTRMSLQEIEKILSDGN